MRYFSLIILLLVLYPFYSGGQINYKGKPAFDFELTQDIPVEILPDVKIRKLNREDRRIESRLKTLRFAEVLEVDFSPETHGIWVNLKNKRIWYLKIKSPGAYSLSLVFDRYRLPVGSKLFIYNADKDHVRGAFTYKNNKINYVLPVAPVKGDEIVLEYHESLCVDFKGELHISSIAHDYKNVFNYLSKSEKGFGQSGDCNININCDNDELWQLLKHSVCKITYNGWLCSGALINNTKEDGYPYLLTANHCINNASEATNAIFYFNYESPGCTSEDGNQDMTISGSTIIATPPERTIDFSLLELSIKPPPAYKPYYAGWNRDISDPTSVTSIHHPRGDIKKITKSFDGATTSDFGEGYDVNKHWYIDEWDEGTTEGGSSGSPLFDQNGRIIGDLTGGDADCSFNFNDYYQQFHRSWQDFEDSVYQLKPWLDPLDYGVVLLNGYLPYDTIPSNLSASVRDTIVNLKWNHVEDTSSIEFYYVYRNSLKLDSIGDSNYNDTLGEGNILHNYFVTAKYSSPEVMESNPSNTVYVHITDTLTLPFSETFVNELIPMDWYEERSNDTIGWVYKAGGFAGILDTAFEGSYNAYFFDENNETSKLVLPNFDFSSYTNLKLTFYMHMQEANEEVHELRVLYKDVDTVEWKTIRIYNTNIETWEKKEIPLPELSDKYKIAFEGVGSKGYGICIDSVSIVEDATFVEPTIFVDKDTICSVDSLQFSTTLDNTYSFLWEFGDSANPQKAVGKGPHWVKYNNSGLVPVRLTVNSTYIKQVYDIAVVYESPSMPSFVNSGDTLTSSSDIGNQWYFNGQPIEDATDKKYIITEDGDYYVEVTNVFNCVSVSEEKKLIVTNIPESPEEDSNERFKIYPNPNNGFFTIEIETFESEIFNYRIYDITGKLRQTGKLNSEEKTKNIELKDFADGIYFIQISSLQESYSYKFLVKK